MVAKSKSQKWKKINFQIFFFSVTLAKKEKEKRFITGVKNLKGKYYCVLWVETFSLEKSKYENVLWGKIMVSPAQSVDDIDNIYS